MSEDAGLPAVVEDVPLPAVAEPDPRIFVMVPFLKYDEDGRIGETGTQSIVAIEMMQDEGELILANEIGDPNKDWIDTSSGSPVVVPRPTLELPASLEVEAGVEVAIEGVPACLVRFTGPLEGEQEHEEGDLEIGFSIPGAYTIRGEAFPHRPFEIALEVTA